VDKTTTTASRTKMLVARNRRERCRIRAIFSWMKLEPLPVTPTVL
jgi:hypothetical protein